LSTRRHTRGEFLKAVGAGSAWIALLNTLGCKPAKRTLTKQTERTPAASSSTNTSPAQPKYVHAFRSRPELRPPAIDVTKQAHGTAPGYIFVAPKRGIGQDGPMIIDNLGQLVWFSKGRYATDFKVQDYQGKPVLTWWEGEISQAHGVGEYVIFDDSYREVTRVHAGNGRKGDLHEFSITPRDTALITIYNSLRGDLSSVGGPADGVVMEGIAQEVEIETGEVLFEWRSLDHVGLEESYEEPKGPGKPFDYFHINSIEVDHDGNWIISARNTSTVYKVDYRAGEVIWRLGGKESDFEMGPGSEFAHQHDARRQPDGTITIFDNRAARVAPGPSRGIVLELDEDEMTATLVREYIHPDKVRSTAQGNMQVLPNGKVFIGWGREPLFSELSRDGDLLFDASFPEEAHSYRAFRFPWSGQPSEDPAVAAEPGSDDNVIVYASWNGATEVATWQVLAGPSPNRLKSISSAPRNGFETPISVHTTEPYVAVQARDRSGEVLGTTKAVKLRN
jgi:hypothetical protein